MRVGEHRKDRVAVASERSDLASAFGKSVRGLRERQGVSKGELARECGIHESVLSAMELGHREPRLQMIVTLARGLGLGGHELVKFAEDQATKAG